MNETDIKDYWAIPEFDLRKNQEIALDWMQEQLTTNDSKYLILELPVGSGKSLLGLTLSKYLNKGNGSSFVLTPQRILQDQYEKDFEVLGKKFLASLHGKSNYKCQSKGASCKIGSLVKPPCEHCPFASAKNYARNASNTVLNYKLALTSFQYTETFEPRKLMILDEAHTLEQHLVDFDSVDITYAMCKKYDINFKVHTEIQTAMEWVKAEYLPVLEEHLSDMEADCEMLFEKASNELTRGDLNKIKETEELAGHVADVMDMSMRTDDYLEENFVLVWDKVMFAFKRISGSYSFHKIIKPMADKFLFMSSTILNKDTFCRDLGIDPDDVSFLSLPSEFSVDNRPVVYMPVMKMNASWNKPENASHRSAMVERIISLLDIHEGDSGILHTANYAIAQWLVEQLDGKISHNIYHHNPKGDMDRQEAINNYIDSTLPAILISPSITEGLDLKDDLARFAMVVKVPFGYLGDQWIKRRMEMSMEWYRRRAITDIIQGGGRIVRGLDDEGTVYILDASFAYLYQQSYNMVPQWWKDSYQTL
mgnify:CR=1 FL=1